MSRAHALRSALLVPALLALAGPALGGQPLDLSDPTPRTIRVSVDQDTRDYGQIAGAFTLPVDAAYVSDGNVATVTIAGAVVENLISTVFSGLANVIPGSFSDYVVAIDVNTREILSASVTGQISSALGTLDVTQFANSTLVGGFSIENVIGVLIPLFCDSGATCTIVPGLPFDPATGTANAPGLIDTGVIAAFTPFGDLRFEERADMDCAVAVNQSDYTGGEAVFAGFYVRNNGAVARTAELKFWVDVSGEAPISIFNVGADFSFGLGPGDEIRFENQPIFIVGPGTPTGQWNLGCRLLDVVRGEELSSSSAPFEIN